MIENKQEVKQPVQEPNKQQEQQPEEPTYNVTLTRAERDIIAYFLAPDKLKIETYADVINAQAAVKFWNDFVVGTKD